MPKPENCEGFELQSRDRSILRTLLDCRIMTIKQAASLHFGGSFEAAKKRLQKIQKAGFIGMRPRRVQDPAIYSLTRQGYMSLKEEGMLDPLLELGWTRMQERIKVSEFILKHELAVVDTKAALAPAIAKADKLDLVDFTLNPEKHAFHAKEAILDSKKLVGFRSMVVKPDGFIHVRERQGENQPVDQYFFLEVDRGTMNLKRIVKKARQYSQFYRSGCFARELGFPSESRERHPFRVLFVVPSAERRNNIAEKLLQAKTPVKTMIWITTMDELSADPLGAIWMRPRDYLIAVSGSTFDIANNSVKKIYRRQEKREALIEAKVYKQHLFV